MDVVINARARVQESIQRRNFDLTGSLLKSGQTSLDAMARFVHSGQAIVIQRLLVQARFRRHKAQSLARIGVVVQCAAKQAAHT